MCHLQAQLHIDGMPTGAHDGPELIDDWALHPVSGLQSTKLVVGACWMGKLLSWALAGWVSYCRRRVLDG